jgi:hypothetical protein
MNEARKAASLLGKLGKGVKKTITEEDRQGRIRRLADARQKRWPRRSGNECGRQNSESDSRL